MRWRDVAVGRKGLAVMAIPVVALVAMGIVVALAAADSQSRRSWVDHTLEVQRSLGSVEGQVARAEASVRGFALTRDASLLTGFSAGSSALPPELDHLNGLVADNPEQRKRAQQLDALVTTRLEQLQALRSDVSASDETAAAADVRAGADQSRAIGETVDTMHEVEVALLAERRSEEDGADRRLRLAVILLVGAGLVGGVAASTLFTRSITRRLRIVTDNASRLAADEAPSPPPEGRDEIGQLGASLQTASELLGQRRDAERDAREAAQVANRAKTDFLSRMSHELRTPLNAVLGFTQVLDMDDLEPRQHEDLARIDAAGRHLLALINEVLDLSRIESGTMTLSTELIVAGEAVDHAVTLMGPIARGVGIDLRVDQACFLARHTVRADRLRLQQVLINLISNAIKYNRPGGSVEVACEPGDRRLRITVTDTGAGISADQQARLFRPFERLGAEKTTIEGTGIGLTLARQLVELMDGALTLTSRVDVGTTFTIELPAGDALGPARSSSAIGSATSTAGRTAGRAVVLQIEDNDANLLLVRRALESRPHLQIINAVDATSGLDLARTHRPDLILLDMHLPDQDGPGVITAIKRDPELAGTPVIVVSADAATASKRTMQELGAAAYLTKPLDLRELVAKVDSILQRDGRAPARQRDLHPDRDR